MNFENIKVLNPEKITTKINSPINKDIIGSNEGFLLDLLFLLGNLTTFPGFFPDFFKTLPLPVCTQWAIL